MIDAPVSVTQGKRFIEGGAFAEIAQAEVLKCGSHLRAPHDCRCSRPAACHPQAVDFHQPIGFRHVIR
ncbi:hypothetical protein [Sphingobium sp. Sx8-8]|uniref:hypothetical protein n=1 Tax=Sphingobium sp. Sx8-8 TaxID=2933617 RepID=UPI001F589D6A|nr:hypothetical protein [Sphingobium sp. Sx8-8]